MNYVGNYLILGKDSQSTGIAYSTGSSPPSRSYFEGNFYQDTLLENQRGLVRFCDHWATDEIRAYWQSVSFETGPVKEEDAKFAFEKVLKHSGASLPR